MRKLGEVLRSVATNLAVNSKVGGDHRNAACHCLHEGMREGFCIGGSNVYICPAVKLMKLRIGNGPELDNHVGDPKLPHQVCGHSRTIWPMFFRFRQLAGHQELKSAAGEPLSQEG